MNSLEHIASNLVEEHSAEPVTGLAPGDPLVSPETRVRIILEENEQIPPTGQFFGLNGKSYVLRPGEACEVPIGIINILNDAVTSVPVKNQADQIVGYRDKLRFPYRLLPATGTQRAM